jgi:hypothetical protein
VPRRFVEQVRARGGVDPDRVQSGLRHQTEYRLAYLNNKNVSELNDGTNVPFGRDINFKPLVQTISTSLVYRFNWGGPVVAKY